MSWMEMKTVSDNHMKEQYSYRDNLIRQLWEAQCEDCPAPAKRLMAEAAQELERLEGATSAGPSGSAHDRRTGSPPPLSSKDKLSAERLRNTRAWAAVRVGTLSGAEVIVGAIDELLQMREDWETICAAAEAMPAVETCEFCNGTGQVNQDLIGIVKEWESLTRLTYHGDPPQKYVKAGARIRAILAVETPAPEPMELCGCCESRTGVRCAFDEIERLRGQLDAAEQHVRILQAQVQSFAPETNADQCGFYGRTAKDQIDHAVSILEECHDFVGDERIMALIREFTDNIRRVVTGATEKTSEHLGDETSAATSRGARSTEDAGRPQPPLKAGGDV